jgi:hypothetical protein
MKPPCAECRGKCCTSAGGFDAVSVGGAIVRFKDGRCPHLEPAGTCAIYGTPAQARCMAFSCVDRADFRARNPDVDALLKAKGL